MPHVEIIMVKGRSAEQKRKIARRVTELLIEEAGARREDTTIAFVDVEKDSFSHGGELVIDRKS